MIRMIKFQARFNLNIESDLKQALLDCRSEILKSSQARILEELFKMLESKASAKFFKLMVDYGVLTPLLPMLSDYLETESGSEIYSYLEEIDMMLKENPNLLIKRAVLLAALVFPIVDAHIKNQFEDSARGPHLGVLHDESLKVIHGVFLPFFQLSRKLKSALLTVVISQYRFTPLVKKKPRQVRISRDPDFLQAMQFFNLRQRLEPGLKTSWERWQSAYLKRKK